jgi:polyisoprenoid-binding protein YceI
MSFQGTFGRAMAGAGLCAALMAGAAAVAAPAPPPPPVKDYKAAPAGKYNIDPNHTAIVARVPHMGLSYSIFRFGTVSGTLDWDPAKPSADSLNVTVDPKSVATPVKDFPAEIAGDRFLKSGQFPAATFVSKAFHATDASHGKVDGDFTLMGVTKPVTFDVELVGAGKGFRGDVMGATARTALKPNDFGLPPPFFGQPIELTIDLELDRQP